MNFLIVDDERAARDDLERVLLNVTDSPEIMHASNADEAVRMCGENNFDAVFMDVMIPGTDGISIAKQILTARPHTNIIIQTADPSRSLDAYRIYASDYIIKPVGESDVRAALEHLRWPVSEELPRLEVRCFGLFDVFWMGESLSFRRHKTKELFAYLIDCNGASVTPEDIACALWEDTEKVHDASNYVRVLLNDLKHTLEPIGMWGAVIRKYGKTAIRKEMIDCDYYRYLEGDRTAEEQFHGEYMTQYSWAERTEGSLWFGQDV